MAQAQPLIINDWTGGIGDSPNVGPALLQNCSIDSVPGTLMPNYAAAFSSFATGISSTGTFSAGVFTLNSPSTTLTTTGVAVTFATTGTLPTGLTAGTVYWLYPFSSNQVIVADTLQHAIGNNPLSITGNGSGTITVSTVDMGQPNSAAKIQKLGILFVADSNGRVWGTLTGGSQFYLMGANTITNGNGQGLAIFETSDSSHYYLFVFRNAVIDVAEVTTTAQRQAPTWTSAWQNLNSTAGSNAVHQALLGYDNIIYACDSQYVVSIQEVPGKIFSPSDSTTYNYNSKALTLPAIDSANCVEQLGQTLLVGGGSTNLIYPWDRISPSFNLPILCPEIGITQMKNIGNQVYILAGQRGNIYSTLGYFVTLAKKVPEYLTQSTSGASNTITWGGVTSKNGALLFGLSTLQGGNLNSGAYLLYPDGRLIIDRLPSQGASRPTVFSADGGEFYYMGYNGGMDFTDTNRVHSLGSAIYQSRLYTVGTKVGQATFSLLEVQLDRPGNTGQQVRISYRTSVEGSWTTLATYTTDGTTTSFDSDIGLTGIQNIQIQVEVSGSANGSSTLAVREVRLLQGTH